MCSIKWCHCRRPSVIHKHPSLWVTFNPHTGCGHGHVLLTEFWVFHHIFGMSEAKHFKLV